MIIFYFLDHFRFYLFDIFLALFFFILFLFLCLIRKWMTVRVSAIPFLFFDTNICITLDTVWENLYLEWFDSLCPFLPTPPLPFIYFIFLIDFLCVLIRIFYCMPSYLSLSFALISMRICLTHCVSIYFTCFSLYYEEIIRRQINIFVTIQIPVMW